tara:strand:+ start:58 stop:300 length:243 start_codon:yes stop_codon:yes gene_type:complete
MEKIEKQKLADKIKKVLKIKKNILFEDLNNQNILAWDSLAKLTLIMVIEEEYNISINANEIERFNSFNEIHKLLENKLNS